MTTAELLERYALAAGLLPNVIPFSSTGSLRERLLVNPYLQAPMAGVSDGAYRLMMRAGGASLAYTEMVSVNGLHYGSDKTWDLLLPDEAEPDIAVQLFGSDPALFAEAASAVAKRLGSRLSLIDINMACPVSKVVRHGAGSALLDDPMRATAIVGACISALHGRLPVTVKMRMGRRAGEDTAVSFAQLLASAGVSAITIHGRTATQLYTGIASWEVVSNVVNAVKVPVIGSGDICDADAAHTMRKKTSASAVMVARGGYGTPWIFTNAHRLDVGRAEKTPSIDQRLMALECHLRLLSATGAHLARGRSLCGWYLRGLPHAAKWRNEAMACCSLDDYLRLFDKLRVRAGVALT